MSMIPPTSPQSQAASGAIVADEEGFVDEVRKERGIPYMTAMASMTTCFTTAVDFVWNNMVPLTLSNFIDNKFAISWIIDVHRMFGFAVQPYVAWKGDRIQTRFGRRRPFLLMFLPGVAFLVVLLGLMPKLIPEAQHHTAFAIILVLFVYVGMQLCQEVCMGCEGPLYGDTFPHKKLGRARSFNTVTNHLMQLFFLNYAMTWADTDQFYPYLSSGCWVLVSLFLVIFVIRENVRKSVPPKKFYNPLQHMGLLKNPDYLKVALIGACALMISACFTLFHSSYVTKTLHLTLREFGQAGKPGPVIGLIFAFPTGFLIDRFGPKYFITAGFCFFAAASTLMLTWVHDYNSLLVANIVNAFASNFTGMAMISLIFLYAPTDKRGQVYGLIQFCRAFLTWLVTPLVGYLAEYVFHSYLPGYMVCICLSIFGFVVVLSTRRVSNHS
jgi:MFS family permease